MFVDSARIVVRGGDGGAGVVSFHRAKGRPRGKPEGGDGGVGGSVIVQADHAMGSLLAYQRNPHHRAGDGTHGEGGNRHGRSGDDLVLGVPLGTVLRDEGGVVLADLVAHGQKVTVANGGRGGRGNASFVGARHKAPSFSEQGEFGEELTLQLELKLIADAALVGFPNAGKSTLISRLSAATPKVADYPFTTLEPHLGVVSIGDREFVLADMPGLIEGAASGRGLGHEFLRHTERARALVFLLDPSPLQSDSVTHQLEVLDRELREHSVELAARPRIVIVSKSDLPDAGSARQSLAAIGVDAMAISAATGEGIAQLIHRVADVVDTAVRQAPERQGFVLHRPLAPRFTVKRLGPSEWLVEGRNVERAVGLDDLTRPEAADLVAERLRRMGVEDELGRAGAKKGDEVRIGGIAFEYQPLDAPDEQDAGLPWSDGPG